MYLDFELLIPWMNVVFLVFFLLFIRRDLGNVWEKRLFLRLTKTSA
jgi:hypothetical protein